jgi:predicted metal-dependent hydrolase
VQTKERRVRLMKTRWGSCNIIDKRIWLNACLSNYPEECLEYVIVHELCHLLERGHNARFYGFVESCLPDWKRRRKILKDGLD